MLLPATQHRQIGRMASDSSIELPADDSHVRRGRPDARPRSPHPQALRLSERTLLLHHYHRRSRDAHAHGGSLPNPADLPAARLPVCRGALEAYLPPSTGASPAQQRNSMPALRPSDNRRPIHTYDCQLQRPNALDDIDTVFFTTDEALCPARGRGKAGRPHRARCPAPP